MDPSLPLRSLAGLSSPFLPTTIAPLQASFLSPPPQRLQVRQSPLSPTASFLFLLLPPFHGRLTPFVRSFVRSSLLLRLSSWVYPNFGGEAPRIKVIRGEGEEGGPLLFCPLSVPGVAPPPLAPPPHPRSARPSPPTLLLCVYVRSLSWQAGQRGKKGGGEEGFLAARWWGRARVFGREEKGAARRMVGEGRVARD